MAPGDDYGYYYDTHPICIDNTVFYIMYSKIVFRT